MLEAYHTEGRMARTRKPFTVRLYPGERRGLRRLARALGRSESDALRFVLLEALRRDADEFVREAGSAARS